MMIITNKWSVRLVNGHGLGFFSTLAEAEAFSNTQAMATTINAVEIHELVTA